MSSAPPRLATRLLRSALGDDDFEAISGDLEEAYRVEIAPKRGRLRARLWYRRQVGSIVSRQVIGYAQSGLEDFAPRRTHMGALRQDLGYAVRTLLGQPAFTTVAVLTLALGIGANVAIFALVNAVLFKPLPFADPERLMAVHLVKPDDDSPGVLRPRHLVIPEVRLVPKQPAGIRVDRAVHLRPMERHRIGVGGTRVRRVG